MDSANLYKTLTEQVVPMFFDRDAQGIPRKWIQSIRRTMVTLVPQFTTDRMVKEYTKKYYRGNEIFLRLTKNFTASARLRKVCEC